jgi:hypothetical protein
VRSDDVGDVERGLVPAGHRTRTLAFLLRARSPHLSPASELRDESSGPSRGFPRRETLDVADDLLRDAQHGVERAVVLVCAIQEAVVAVLVIEGAVGIRSAIGVAAEDGATRLAALLIKGHAGSSFDAEEVAQLMVERAAAVG